ncbi:MAG: alpha/beta hydrolase family protein [archaeon]
MNGFGDAVNGHYDVADQLSNYLRERAAQEFANERAEKQSIDSVREFEARRERVRETFLATIGGLPDRSADHAIETRGVLECDGYAIELVTFESRPNVHVTANCYVPDGEGPHPAVLFLCGHVRAAKADPWNQRAAVELALNGFVVLVLDPLGQGERRQYRDTETGETIVGGGGGVFAHSYAGQQCLYAGANLARYVIHDARCGLDVLVDRDDVDPGRIGVTGASGGGIQTLYLSLVDDRIDAAAPCCAVTERSEWLRTGKRIDAEQLVPGAIPRGINVDDFVTSMAPRPVFVGAAAWDEYFPIEGVHETVERARRIYDLYDAGENVDLVVADEPHCSVYELGDGVFEWFCDRLGNAPFEPHEELAVFDEAELHCTPAGSVRAAFRDERSIDDLIRTYVTDRYPDAGEKSIDTAADSERVRRAVIETFDLDREDCELHPRYVSRDEADGLDVEHVFFKTERDPDVVVTGVLVSDPGVPPRSPAVVLYEDGTEELADRRDEVATLAAEYGTVFVFDPRGVGAVRNRAIPIPAWVDDYDGIYGTEFKLAYDALLLDTSLFGLRIYDVLRALQFVRSSTGREGTTLVGEGVGAYHALYAAVVDRDVETVDLRNLGPSFHGMATRREYPYDARLTAFDVIGDCDVPDALTALERRGLADRSPVERTDQ